MKPAEASATELYKRLLGYAGPYWRLFLLAVLTMALFAATDTGFAALMKPMLDGSFVDHDPDTIRYVPVVLVLLFLFRGITGFASRYIMTWIGRRIIQQLRQEVFTRMLHLPMRYFDRNPSGRMLSRMTFDIEQVAEASTNAVTVLIRDSLTITFLLIYMFMVSSWLTSLFLLVGPFLILLLRLVSRRFRLISHRIQESMGELTQFSEEAIHGQQLVKASGAEKRQADLFSRVNERNRRLHMKLAVAVGASTPVIQFIAACVLALVVYLASVESVTSQISVGSFVSFIAAMLLMLQPIKRLTNVNALIQRGVAAARSIFSLLDEAVEEDRGQQTLTRASGDIEFRDVSFAYDSGQAPVLDGVSFHIKQGEMIALVGRSGSGKSTLARLLLRFYQPDSGVITLDGQVLDSYRLDQLREQFAFVSQEVILFNDSLANNIGYARQTQADDADILKAARAAHAMEFIDRLPDGLQTRVGDRGVMLSGGQRQRIAIARALLRDAPLLILDEATSSLDSETEQQVQAALDELMAGRTALVIAHRLSTVLRADRILVMDKGRVVESGNHTELLSRGGLYADLYNRQNGDVLNQDA